MDTIEVIRGDSKTISLTFSNSDGTAQDITGSTVRFTVRNTLPETSTTTDSDAVITKTITSHSAPSSGQTTISLTTTDTNLEPSKYWYDIQIRYASGDLKTLGPGLFNVTADITRQIS